MVTDKAVEIFHVGPQKTATTWVFQCLREHPEIIAPHADAIHYFSMFYHRGRAWYLDQFPDGPSAGKLYDPTPNYFRSPEVPARIYRENPEAKIIVCLRHPVERAFSHYWHEKKKGRFNFRFEEVLENYDLFTNWLEPGFYSTHLTRIYDFFPKSQVLIQFFDDLETDPAAFLKELLEFLEIDAGFQPSVLGRKVNAARPPQTVPANLKRRMAASARALGLEGMVRLAKKGAAGAGFHGQGAAAVESMAEVDRSVRRELEAIFDPEYDRLEALLGRSFQAWRDRRLGEPHP